MLNKTGLSLGNFMVEPEKIAKLLVFSDDGAGDWTTGIVY